MYKGRTCIIKVPLIRHVIRKRDLTKFIKKHGEVSGRLREESGRDSLRAQDNSQWNSHRSK